MYVYGVLHLFDVKINFRDSHDVRCSFSFTASVHTSVK